MAESSGQDGNALYKAGKFEEALATYQKASELDPKEPKYPSNASAVCYELGRYGTAITYILAAWTNHSAKNSTVEASDAFAIKLATRFAKSKLNGISNGTIELHDETHDLEGEIDKFALDDSPKRVKDLKVKEMEESWKQLRAARAACAGHSQHECDAPQRIDAAAKRLRALPIYKSCAEPTLEYFTFSHDLAKSLLHGLTGLESDPHDLDTEASAAVKDWSFLFGGSGDGRHVFTTLQHLAWMKKKRQIDNLNVHITLVDIHPATLARILIIISLLEKILAAEAKDNEQLQILLHTTLFYTFTWLMMPSYCHAVFLKIVQKLIKDLDDENSTISRLTHIDKQSLDAIMVFLRYWSKPLVNKSVSPILDGVYTSNIFDKINGIPPIAIPGMTPRENPERTRPRKPSAYADYEGEKDVFIMVPVLLPPRRLASLHPALNELALAYTSPSATEAAKKARQEVLETWKLNPTIFDNSSTEHPNLSRMGYPTDVPDPYDIIDGFAHAVHRFHFVAPPEFSDDMTAFDLGAWYFETAAHAIDMLRDGLKIEIVVGDVMSGIPRLFQGDLEPRPEQFPRKFSRMWLSNVPDYTQGFLSTAIYLLPYLQPEQLAISNLLLNSMSWDDMDHFCFNYSLLFLQDFPRFLGCEVLQMEDGTWGEMALKPLSLPRQPTELASKKELHDWLARLLLCILRNGEYQPSPRRIAMPANLGMFFHLLVHLCRVGYPSHWISDFAQAVITDTLSTDARPYLGKLPITKDYARQKNPTIKVHLSAWRAGMEVIVASSTPALPFSLTLPDHFPVLDDICIYTARVQRPMMLMMLMQPYSAFTQTLGIIFYKPSPDVDGFSIASSIEKIIDGSSNVKGTDVQILLSLERVNIARGEVSWRMSKQWYRKMQNEEWSMVVYRDDGQAPITDPSHVYQWREVTAST